MLTAILLIGVFLRGSNTTFMEKVRRSCGLADQHWKTVRVRYSEFSGLHEKLRAEWIVDEVAYSYAVFEVL